MKSLYPGFFSKQFLNFAFAYPLNFDLISSTILICISSFRFFSSSFVNISGRNSNSLISINDFFSVLLLINFLTFEIALEFELLFKVSTNC